MSTINNNIETEYIELNSKNGWMNLYQIIKEESSKHNFKCLESLKPQNKNLNRYRDVSPYDHSRIILNRGSCDYINANLVKVESANRQYILTQGPLAETIGNFWLMIWEQKSRAILMLNKLIEKKQVKCCRYWPQSIGYKNEMVLENVGLTVVFLEQYDYNNYTTRLFRLIDNETNGSQLIHQFHYLTWPDFGVPSSPIAFLEFLKMVRKSGSLDSSVGPAVIHCSAGIGRSGTFCLVDSCLVLIEKDGVNSVNIKDVLLEMRKYRMGLIQTPDQLRFSYQAIIEGAKQLSEPEISVDKKDCDFKLYSSNSEEEEYDEEECDEPPPLPPPRGESLGRSYMDGNPVNRPLPTIPNSASLNEISHSPNAPSRPLPESPGNTSDDELHSPTQIKDAISVPSPTRTAEIRQRRRAERRENMAAQVQNMKKRQQKAENWAEFKRSFYKPVVIGVSVLLLGGGILAYTYFRN